MRKIAIFLMLSLILVISGCTKIDVVDLDISSLKEINNTKVPVNESRAIIGEEEGLVELPNGTAEYSCTEKVLLAYTGCKFSEDTKSMDVNIVNNGYLNVSIAFYLYNNTGLLAKLYNKTIFPPKARWVFILPLAELEGKYGRIEKIHATPLLVEGDNIMSCTNKKLPILVESCG